MQRVSPIINSQRQPNLEKSEYNNHQLYKLIDVRTVIGPNMPKAQTSLSGIKEPSETSI